MQHRKLDRLMTPVERIARVAAAGLTSATSSATKPSGAKSYDNADGTRTIIGNVANGESNPSYTMATHVGDTTAPGTPTGVTASSKSGVVVVEWDGTLTGGIPDDFFAVRVYLDGSELGILTGAGSVSSASLEGGTTHSVTATAEDDACLPDGTPAHNVSAPTAAISVTVSEGVESVAAEVEQVRQDVADFRDDVATTYATKVEREDGDDAVKTWVTTNYTNSNDLATTYATKTLVSQTKDAIELAASQTYETQTDAAATYATKSALTVGLDGIRSEVAEDYQPKGDYATTASMNSAIQQSASSIESSVAATYLKQSDASTTYATKTEVQQTASGLDTRITTAQSTADGAASTAATASSNATAALNKVDGLQVGGTNLASDVKLWYTRTASSEFTAQGITVKQLGDGLYSAMGTTTGAGDIWFQTSNIDAALSRDPGDYVMSVYVESGTWPSSNFYLQLAAYRLSGNTWNRNIRTANDSTSQAFTCETDYPRHFGFYSNTSGVEVNITFRLKLERGNMPTDWSPAPEDMATEADLQAEVTERQTLIRQFSGGVLAGYVGNSVTALMNAAGSFDVVQTTWSDGTPTVTDTLASFDSQEINIGPLRISTIQSGGGSPAGFVYADPVAIGSFIDSSSGEVMGGFWSESTEPSIVGTSLTLAPVELASGVPRPGTPTTFDMTDLIHAFTTTTHTVTLSNITFSTAPVLYLYRRGTTVSAIMNSAVNASSAGTRISVGTVPAGYRPPQTVVQSGVCVTNNNFNGNYQWRIESSGAVTYLTSVTGAREAPMALTWQTTNAWPS